MEIKLAPNVYSSKCPTRKALDLITNKWTPLLIGLLEEGPRRFSELQRSTDGISQKVLTQTLRRLERHGLVTRTAFPEVPPHVEYELTELGRTLSEPLRAIRHWAQDHIDEVNAAVQDYAQRSN